MQCFSLSLFCISCDYPMLTHSHLQVHAADSAPTVLNVIQLYAKMSHFQATVNSNARSLRSSAGRSHPRSFRQTVGRPKGVSGAALNGWLGRRRVLQYQVAASATGQTAETVHKAAAHAPGGALTSPISPQDYNCWRASCVLGASCCMCLHCLHPAAIVHLNTSDPESRTRPSSESEISLNTQGQTA